MSGGRRMHADSLLVEGREEISGEMEWSFLEKGMSDWLEL